MESYALRPSSDTRTEPGRKDTAARTLAASASVPARAWSTNWYGRVASSKTCAPYLASVLATRRRKTSPEALCLAPLVWLAQRCEARHGQTGSDICRDMSVREVRGRFSQQF